MKLVTAELLNEITSRIVEAVAPYKVILFGSHAWGGAGESSDVDLLVIVRHSEELPYRRARKIYRCLRGIGVPVDIIVQTQHELERSNKVATSLARAALEKGRVLYG